MCRFGRGKFGHRCTFTAAAVDIDRVVYLWSKLLLFFLWLFFSCLSGLEEFTKVTLDHVMAKSSEGAPYTAVNPPASDLDRK